MPLDNRMRPFIAWYGDMSLITHLKRLLKYSTIRAKLQFHPNFIPQGMNRKNLSEESRKASNKRYKLIIKYLKLY